MFGHARTLRLFGQLTALLPTINVYSTQLNLYTSQLISNNPTTIHWGLEAAAWGLCGAASTAGDRLAHYWPSASNTTTTTPLQTPTNPYTLLGVTVTSTDAEITSAYHAALLHSSSSSIPLPSFWQSKAHKEHLLSLRDAHGTLTDQFRRCLYHRESMTPDWYGTPLGCGGEIAIYKLKIARAAVRTWKVGYLMTVETVGRLRRWVAGYGVKEEERKVEEKGGLFKEPLKVVKVWKEKLGFRPKGSAEENVVGDELVPVEKEAGEKETRGKFWGGLRKLTFRTWSMQAGSFGSTHPESTK